MATLAEIKARPDAYLGEGTGQDYNEFIEAVETLMAAGIGEAQAVEIAWNDGDCGVPVSAIRDGWIPTHVITSPFGQTYVMCGDNNALYTAAEWVYCDNADYEFDTDGTLLFQGRLALDSTIRPL